MSCDERAVSANTVGAGLLCLLMILVAADTFAQESEALIDKALQLSGLTAQLDAFPSACLSSIPQDAFPDEKTREEVHSAVKKKANKEALTAAIREELRQSYNVSNIQAVLAFYETRSGRKFSRVQAGSLNPVLIRTLREGRKSAVSLSEARLEIIRRLIQADGVVDANERLLRNVIRGMMEGATAGDGIENEAGTREGFLSIADDIRLDPARTDGLAVVAFAHSLQPLDDAELKEVIAHRESTPGGWFREAVRKGLERAALLTGRAIGDGIMRRKGGERSQ